jgi:MinD superfamily P-loop ATPase
MSGCSDPECCCSLCRLPVGIPEEDPRWAGHYEDCGGCELCEDQTPIMLFRGEGNKMEQAIFHTACFKRAVL